MIKTLDYTKDKKLGNLVRDRNTKGIGQHIQEELLELIARDNLPAQTLFALSEDRYVIGEAAYATHNERHQAATLIGRECVQEFGDERILYLVMSAPVVSSDADSGLLPNDDPHRQTGAMTFVIALEKLHEAQDLQGYIDVLNDWDYYVWSAQHHEGLVTETIWDGATVCPSGESNRQPKDGVVFAQIDNYNLMAFFTAVSGNFALIRRLSEGKSKSEIDAEFSPLFAEKGIAQVDVKRTKLEKYVDLGKALDKRVPLTELPDVIKTEELSTESQELLLSFGMDALAKLNEYAIAAEDALIECVSKAARLQERLLVLSDEVKHLREQAQSFQD